MRNVSILNVQPIFAQLDTVCFKKCMHLFIKTSSLKS